jgi:hypothetical protein
MYASMVTVQAIEACGSTAAIKEHATQFNVHAALRAEKEATTQVWESGGVIRGPASKL